MKLWLISSSYPRSPSESINAGVLARSVALGAAGLGHEVTVVTPDKPGGIEFDDELAGVALRWPRPTVQLADINPKRPFQAIQTLALLFSARRTLRRMLREEPPDGVIALWALPSGLFARWVWRWASKPYVTWILGSDVWMAPRIPLAARVLRMVLKDSEANYADGSELAQSAQDVTGVPVQVLSSSRVLPEPSGKSPKPVDILFVGRYHGHKAPDLLLEGVGAMDTTGLVVRFHGQGDLHPQLLERAGQVGFDARDVIRGPIGAVDLSDLLRNTGVLVIPSRVDSVPMILADAVQAATPVVVTDVGDMGRLVREFQLGVVVPPQDAGALAEGIDEVLRSDRYPDPSGLEQARRHFSPAGAAATLIEHLEE